MPLPVHHFSDVLCIWAYAADVRFHNLADTFAEQIALHWHFIPVYGDVPRRIERTGLGVDGYARKIQSVAERFDHIDVHPELFLHNLPQSSLPAHRLLAAVRWLEDHGETDAGAVARLTGAIRQRFFVDAEDVSNHAVLWPLVTQQADGDAVQRLLASGQADAELGHDLWLQREQRVRVSPTVILDGDRQHLEGNVGYRVIEACVSELLRDRSTDRWSWC